MVEKVSYYYLILIFRACFSLALPLDGAETITDATQENGNQLSSLQVGHNLEDVIASIAAEFVFVVGGDHVLMPIPEPPLDYKLHVNAIVLARLIQKLHLSEKVYNLLNLTAQEVAFETRHSKKEQNLLFLVIDKVEKYLKNDPELFKEYLNEHEELKKQALQLPTSHGENMSNQKQTTTEVIPEQIIKGEELLHHPRVKALILCVIFLQQSQQPLNSIPFSSQRLSDYTKLAKAVYKVAKKSELRAHVQKVFDETLEEYIKQFETLLDADSILFYQKLSKKIQNDEVLKREVGSI